jgi:hypothetical protein
MHAICLLKDMKRGDETENYYYKTGNALLKSAFTLFGISCEMLAIAVIPDNYYHTFSLVSNVVHRLGSRGHLEPQARWFLSLGSGGLSSGSLVLSLG